MAEPQTYKNHTRFDPAFHFFLAPALLLNVLATAIWYMRHHDTHPHSGPWLLLISVVLLVLVVTLRRYAAQNQDRIIRLEERIRYASLLSPADLALTAGLSARQIISLRFASDAELPALAARAVRENLSSKQIKQSIGVWRPDTFRV